MSTLNKKMLIKHGIPTISEALSSLQKKLQRGFSDENTRKKNETDFSIVSAARDFVALGIAAKERAEALSKSKDGTVNESSLSESIKNKLNDFISTEKFDVNKPEQSMMTTFLDYVKSNFALPEGITSRYEQFREAFDRTPVGQCIEKAVEAVSALYQKAEPQISAVKDKAKDFLDVNKDGQLNLADMGAAVENGASVIGKVARKLPDISGIDSSTSENHSPNEMEHFHRQFLFFVAS